MEYRIDYGPVQPEKERAGGRCWFFRPLTAAFLLVFVLTVRLCWPAGRETLRGVLLPDPDSPTAQAFALMVSDLSQGAPVGETVTAFCAELLEHGQNPD